MERNKDWFQNIHIRSSETIAHELLLLREHLENNNIVEVNKCVNSLLSNPEFKYAKRTARLQLKQVKFLMRKK